MLHRLGAGGDVEAQVLPDLLHLEAIAHEVAALDHEVLALGALGGRELRVVVLESHPPEGDVPRLVLGTKRRRVKTLP